MDTECRKVQALMSLYIDDALSYNLKMFVYNHLQKCRPCMKKYLELKKAVQFVRANLHKTANILTQEPIFDVIKYENFKENVSAYLDGELSQDEVADFKEYLNAMPIAREYFNTCIKNNSYVKSFIKTKSPTLNQDLSKKVLKKIKFQRMSNKFCYKDMIFSLIFAVFVCISIYTLEHNIINHQIKISQDKITLAKIKENIIKLHFKDFLY